MGFILSICNCCEPCFTTVTSKNSIIKQPNKPISIGMDEFRNLSLKESPDTAANIQSSSPTTPIKFTHIFTTQTYTSSPASAIPHTSSPLDTQSLGHTCHITTPSLHPPPRPTPPPPPPPLSPQVTTPPRSTFADQPRLEPPAPSPTLPTLEPLNPSL